MWQRRLGDDREHHPPIIVRRRRHWLNHNGPEYTTTYNEWIARDDAWYDAIVNTHFKAPTLIKRIHPQFVHPITPSFWRPG